MSVAKTDDQKESGQANIKILKARMVKDGQIFENCIFDNDTMEIRITDNRYNRKIELKKYDEEDLKKLEESASSKYHSKVSSTFHDDNNTVGEVKTDGATPIIPVNVDFEKNSTNSPIKQFSEKTENLSDDDKKLLHEKLMNMRVNQGDVRKE